MKENIPLLTICIPTCYGGASLVQAVRSLKASAPTNTEFIVVADSRPLSLYVKSQLRELSVNFIENKEPKSQIAKIKQMLAMVHTKYVIFTQDDIIVSSDAIDEVISFITTHPYLTMMTVRNIPIKPKTWVGRGLSAGTHVAYHIENMWMGGQNYLRGCGRFLLFKTSFLKLFRIPENVVNVDAYLYFENNRCGGSFDRVEKARIFYSLPTILAEQIRKSSRYQYSAEELVSYFSPRVLIFHIPLMLKIKAALLVFLERPYSFSLYVPLLVITRIIRQTKKDTVSTLWKVDESTK